MSNEGILAFNLEEATGFSYYSFAGFQGLRVQMVGLVF
jgi:hypothetical protein